MRFLLLIFALLVGSERSSIAADFTCIDHNALTLGKVVRNEEYEPRQVEQPWMPDPFRWEGDNKSFPTCQHVSIQGKIVPGDADKLEWLLTLDRSKSVPKSPPSSFSLWSPGGNVLEAMTMGRLLRVSYASVEAKRSNPSRCGHPGEPVCCASACALAYLGGAEWGARDSIGVHRPTLEDLGELDYAEAREALGNIGVLVRKYFKEMELDQRLFDTMMRTAPDELSIITISKRYPPALYDWLIAKCTSEPDLESKESCASWQFFSFATDLNRENINDTEIARLTWYSYKSAASLKSMLRDVGRIRRIAIEHELQKREQEHNKP
jgi:hypothetical protein